MTLDFKAGNLSADELTPNFDTGKGFVAPKASPVFAEMSLSFKSLDTVMDSQIDLRCAWKPTPYCPYYHRKAKSCGDRRRDASVWSLCSSEMALRLFPTSTELTDHHHIKGSSPLDHMLSRGLTDHLIAILLCYPEN